MGRHAGGVAVSVAMSGYPRQKQKRVSILIPDRPASKAAPRGTAESIAAAIVGTGNRITIADSGEDAKCALVITNAVRNTSYGVCSAITN
jgi:hypothetical protein